MARNVYIVTNNVDFLVHGLITAHNENDAIDMVIAGLANSRMCGFLDFRNANRSKFTAQSVDVPAVITGLATAMVAWDCELPTETHDLSARHWSDNSIVNMRRDAGVDYATAALVVEEYAAQIRERYAALMAA